MPEILMNSGLKDETSGLSQLSAKYWSPNTCGQWSQFDPQLIKDIYNNEIKGQAFNTKRVMVLELSQYLENYLWPNYRPAPNTTTCLEHLMSVVVMINEKYRERVNVWQCFETKPEFFGQFMAEITHLILSADNRLSFKERISLLVFIIHCFNCVEVKLINEQMIKYLSLQIWANLSVNRLDTELRTFADKKRSKYKKYLSSIKEKDKLLAESVEKDPTEETKRFERRFLYELIKQFFGFLSLIPSVEVQPKLDRKMYDIIHYCERFLELMIDLESIMQTRRLFNALMDDMNVVIIAKMSNLAKRPPQDSKLFGQLLEMLRFYAQFEIDDLSGEALTEQQMMRKHYDSIHRMQKHVFKQFPDLRDVYIANVSAIDSRPALHKHFERLNDSDLVKLCALLGLGDEQVLNECRDRQLIFELFVSKHERQSSQLQALNEMPLYPSETIIWDENLISSQQFSGADSCLALPKLNLQFLTLHDYLLRNFHLFRLESTYEIRQDIETAVSHMKPWRTETGGVMFGGWARMAIGIESFTIVEVRKPNLGEKHPSRVRADIVVNLNVRKEVKREWESLRRHDVCFLVTVRPTCPPGTHYKFKEPFIPQVGLTYVRGCEVEGMLDPQGKIIDETALDKPYYDTDNRTYRVWLDCNQYMVDMDKSIGAEDEEDVYDSFNILVRRKPKENNFKAVLETIRDLMNTECVVPDWLQEVVLGFGDPSAAHYSNLSSKLSTIDFCDTFLDFEHLKESFPDYNIETNTKDSIQLCPPFKLTFNEELEVIDAKDEVVKEGAEDEKKESKKKSIIVRPYVLPNRGPYPMEVPKKNSVRFTPTQVEAIKSGVEPGLTVVVGPPGTGKTDVAVQIISNLYHNFPEQRTLIVTHSNQALNALFEKIMALDIDERHLLRLGHGEEALETEKDFSRYGRVNYVLAKRIDLLNKVEFLAQSLDIKSDVGYTCETAGYFYLYHVLSRWELFFNKLSSTDRTNVQTVEQLFPFKRFFESAPQPLFRGQSFEEDLEIARGCYRYLKKIFTQLDEFKAFEMLRSGLDRSNYLLVREAKIIAMTCTHAALKRKELVTVGFQYDNILMEESAQILEIETFIPLLLQNPEHGHNRLKRWIMIGDHHQLPPVIKNITFQKFSNMEQSLFTRFIRLGVPSVDLDAQGRARPDICALYNWRYKNLGDLAHVLTLPEYQFANSGFRFDYQLINVEDFHGMGESEPVPFFYQNLAEAEYTVATFMFMRLLGYPSEKITILTTYNGQKHLIRDVVKQRCASNPFIGYPSKITTVDKYQGQQNDYILLSLVRTRTVGHIRDVRRLVVALSRARLGLYIFSRVSLFQSCFELSNAFKRLTQRPLKLEIIPNENYANNSRKISDSSLNNEEIVVIEDMSQMVQFVYQFYQKKIDEWKRDKPEVFERLTDKSAPNESTADVMEDEVIADKTNAIEREESSTEDEEELGFEKLTEDDTGKKDIEADVNMSDEEKT